MKGIRRFLGIASALLAALGIVSCSPKAEPHRALSERERDSTLGKSVIPGAAGVTRALEASDSAAARAQRMDGTVSGQ
ncbi:MAG: hypothetical protein ABI960_08125 [Candidatus Eisenbacteria bacterium]